MEYDGFVVGMAATVSLAAYERPTEIIRIIRRWTIVSRFGPQNEYLTVSVAAAMEQEQAEAPIGLAPVKTVLGVLLSENERGCESTFLLVRQLPRQVRIAGVFFPADGYARVGRSSGTFHLRAEGRHAHGRQRLNGRDVRVDIPEPAPGAEWAMAWHVDAARRPWAGEFFVSARNSTQA